MSIDGKLFRTVMGSFATGVTIATTEDSENQPYGVTVNSFTSVSLDPPLILICLDNRLNGLEAFLEKGVFAVNILAADQEDWSTHCATRGTDRGECITARGLSGIPVVEDPLALIECELKETVPAGDHQILLGEVTHLQVSPDIDNRLPLLFYRGRYAGLSSD